MAPTGKSLDTRVASAPVIGPVTGRPVRSPLFWVVSTIGEVASVWVRPVAAMSFTPCASMFPIAIVQAAPAAEVVPG